MNKYEFDILLDALRAVYDRHEGSTPLKDIDVSEWADAVEGAGFNLYAGPPTA